LVVQHDWIAGRIGAIGDSKARPERAGVHRAEKLIAALVVNSEDQVNDLNVVVPSYLAVWVGRVYPETEDIEIVLVGHSLKIDQWSGDNRGGHECLESL
jgi:hypothetical protein